MGLIILDGKRVKHTPATPTGRPYFEWRWYTEKYGSGAYVVAERKRGKFSAIASGSQGYCHVSLANRYETIDRAALDIPAFYVRHYHERMNDKKNLFREIDADNYKRACEFAKSLGIDIAEVLDGSFYKQ